MSISEKLKSLGAMVGGLLLILGLFAVGIGILAGMTAFSVWIMKWTAVAFEWGLVALLMSGVAAIVPHLRPLSSVVLMVLWFVFGSILWLTGLAVTYLSFGITGVVIGLLFLGVGPVPIAMFALLVHGQWVGLFGFVILLALMFGCRVGAFWLGAKVDERAARKARPMAEVFE